MANRAQPMPMNRCLVALGSNVGDRAQRLAEATRALAELPATELTARSGWVETMPVGGPPDQSAFLNAAVTIETEMAPDELLDALQTIEREAERTRGERWAARTLDVDLLLYGDAVLATDQLRVPHPRMTYRPFVLGPAVEIAANWRHPQLNATLGELLETLQRGEDRILVLGGKKKIQTVGDALLEISRKIFPDQTADSSAQSFRVRATTTATTQVNSAARPKLQILADRSATPLDAAPTVWLDAAPADSLASELAAAIECVWQGLG